MTSNSIRNHSLHWVVLLGAWLAFSLPVQAMESAAPENGMPGSGSCECPAGIELEGSPWVRMMPPGMPSSAAYLSLRNTTDTAVDLVGAESPLAAATELHDHVEDEHGVMRMREVEAITLPAQGRVDLQPGGLHVMLIGLQAPLEVGQEVSITLHLATGDVLELQLPVREGHAPSGTDTPHHHH